MCVCVIANRTKINQTSDNNAACDQNKFEYMRMFVCLPHNAHQCSINKWPNDPSNK